MMILHQMHMNVVVSVATSLHKAKSAVVRCSSFPQVCTIHVRSDEHW
jgi:hypothetical protein